VARSGFLSIESDLRRLIGRWLEDGTIASSKIGFFARALAHAHAPVAARGLARKLDVPASVVTVTVGGATLGGSGKTRVAIACARLFAEQGANVAIVGHAYRAKSKAARIVTPASAMSEVGDEALVCARALQRSRASARVRVVVAESRQRAVDFVVDRDPKLDVLVIDGPVQLRPRRADLALLAVDTEHPWGAGLLLPAGDLRGPPRALLSLSDMLVHVDATPAFFLYDGRAQPIGCLEGMRLGFFSAMARPRRLLSALARANVAPSVVIHSADHGPLARATIHRVVQAETDVEMWIASEKCALHLEGLGLRRPIATFESAADLPGTVTLRVQSLIAHARSRKLTEAHGTTRTRAHVRTLTQRKFPQ